MELHPIFKSLILLQEVVTTGRVKKFLKGIKLKKKKTKKKKKKEKRETKLQARHTDRCMNTKTFFGLFVLLRIMILGRLLALSGHSSTHAPRWILISISPHTKLHSDLWMNWHTGRYSVGNAATERGHSKFTAVIAASWKAPHWILLNLSWNCKRTF